MMKKLSKLSKLIHAQYLRNYVTVSVHFFLSHVLLLVLLYVVAMTVGFSHAPLANDRVQPLYGAVSKESSGTGLASRLPRFPP